jgi:hypothetical protein
VKKVKTDNKFKDRKRLSKGFVLKYDKTSECMVLDIKDTDGMFPLILKIPSAGPYRITRKQSGKLQMTT